MSLVTLNYSSSASLVVKSDDFVVYRRELWLNLGVAMSANLLAFMLIMQATPRHMNLYRYFLLNILFAAFSVDFYFMTMLQPYPLLTVDGYCTLGIIQYGGVIFGGLFGMGFLCFLLGLCATSICSAAVYRLLALYNKNHLMVERPCGLITMVAAHLLITTPFLIMGAFGIEEVYQSQPMIRQAIYRDVVGLRDMLNSDAVCLFISLDTSAIMSSALTMVFIVMTLIGCVYVSIMGVVFITLIRRRKQYSTQLYKMHKMLCISLVFQFAVPGATLYATFFIAAIGALLRKDMLANIVFVSFRLFSMHSTLNALVMVFATRPYRTAVLRWLTQIPFLRWLDSAPGIRFGGVPTISVNLGTELGKKREKTQMVLTRLVALRNFNNQQQNNRVGPMLE